MTGVCLFVCVVGLGFDSTSPAFVRSRASQAAGSDGRLTQKNGIGPPSLGAGIVLTPFGQMYAAVQPRTGCVLLDQDTFLSHSSHHCPTQNKQISPPQIIFTQSRRQITSISTIPPLTHPHTRHTQSLQLHPHTHQTVSPGFVNRPRWIDEAAGQMER